MLCITFVFVSMAALSLTALLLSYALTFCFGLSIYSVDLTFIHSLALPLLTDLRIANAVYVDKLNLSI